MEEVLRWIGFAAEFFEAWEPYTRTGTEDRVRCSRLCLYGEDDLAQMESMLIFEAVIHYLDSIYLRHDASLVSDQRGRRRTLPDSWDNSGKRRHLRLAGTHFQSRASTTYARVSS